MSTTTITLGSRLRELRTAKGLTQDKVARGLEDRGHILSARSIGVYETDSASPSYTTLRAIAELLDGDYHELCDLAAQRAA